MIKSWKITYMLRISVCFINRCESKILYNINFSISFCRPYLGLPKFGKPRINICDKFRDTLFFSRVPNLPAMTKNLELLTTLPNRINTIFSRKCLPIRYGMIEIIKSKDKFGNIWNKNLLKNLNIYNQSTSNFTVSHQPQKNVIRHWKWWNFFIRIMLKVCKY